MGQMANGLLYGCEAPTLPNDEDGEALYDLVMRWEKARKIPWTYEGLKIRIEREGGKSLLGVWVAVGGSGEDGAPDFLQECMLLADVSNVYAKNIKKAESLWQKFAAWAEKHEGLKLPLPKLWLTPCETA